MAYKPKQWVNGETIMAEDLNHLEQGVANEQVGPPGEKGPPGADGAPGKGVPAGGTKDQMLVKASDADYDTKWADPPDGGWGYDGAGQGSSQHNQGGAYRHRGGGSARGRERIRRGNGN